MRKWKKIRPYEGSAPSLSYSGPGYRVNRRTDRWAEKWLKENKIHQPTNFFDLKNLDMAFVRRGSGIIYDYNDERQKGVVLQRRGQNLRVKSAKRIKRCEIHQIFLFAARHDWSRYYFQTAARTAKNLGIGLSAVSKSAKAAAAEIASICQPGITEVRLNLEVSAIIKCHKLDTKTTNLVYRYLKFLKRALNV